MKRIVLISFAVIVLINAETGKECSTDNQCQPDECCQILSEFLVVSKKRASTGTCQKYTPEGEPCEMLGRINGYCSCYPGFTCTALEVPIEGTISVIEKRRPPPPRPGYTYDIKCVKDTA